MSAWSILRDLLSALNGIVGGIAPLIAMLHFWRPTGVRFRGPDRVVTPVQWRAHIAAGLFWFVVAVCSVLMSWATP